MAENASIVKKEDWAKTKSAHLDTATDVKRASGLPVTASPGCPAGAG
jgi:hypothetical protein